MPARDNQAVIADPRVTVLMPVFNAEKYIADAVRSVLDQSFLDFELLIVNDGSTDGTASIILGFDDPRIRLLNCANSGVAAALNYGLQEAKGSYIARFDADDICYTDRLRIQVQFSRFAPGTYPGRKRCGLYH
jgi:glycosyltransferase involved in cell wall biosynthesis